MRILVTGGAGFIGSHLVERLLARGDEVRVLDDLSTGSTENLASAGAPGMLAIGTILDRSLVQRELDRLGGVDRVIHLAATVGVERVAMAPRLTEDVNGEGTRIVLGEASARGIPAITMSSSEVYGFEPSIPVDEAEVLTEVTGDAPRLSYVRSKLVADRFGRELHDAGHAVLTLRPFNVIGPRQSPCGGAVLPRFVERALLGDRLEVHGDGAQRRTFLDVRDLARFLADLVAMPRWSHDVMNIGGIEENSILELAKNVVDRLGSTSTIEAVAPPVLRGDVEIQRRVPNLGRLRATIDATPRRTIADSIDALAAAIAPPVEI